MQRGGTDDNGTEARRALRAPGVDKQCSTRYACRKAFIPQG